MEKLKTIAFTADTEKRGINPVVRSMIKAQAINALDLASRGFVEGNDRKMHKAIAIDESTGETVYATIEVTIGFSDGSKVKTKSAKVTEVNALPDLFQKLTTEKWSFFVLQSPSLYFYFQSPSLYGATSNFFSRLADHTFQEKSRAS